MLSPTYAALSHFVPLLVYHRHMGPNAQPNSNWILGLGFLGNNRQCRASNFDDAYRRPGRGLSMRIENPTAASRMPNLKPAADASSAQELPAYRH